MRRRKTRPITLVTDGRGTGHAHLENSLRTLELLTEGRQYQSSRFEVLTNGEEFYQAELEAISNAERTITLEAYIFHQERLPKRFLDALSQRARDGVEVRLLVDALGNWHVDRDYYQPLVEAGGKLAFFRPLSDIIRINRRSHREVLIIDGRLAFTGGAGFADRWLYPQDGQPRWRDTMFRIAGDVVPILQGIFFRAWFEASNELVIDPRYFQPAEVSGHPGLVVSSRPRAEALTPARVLLQVMLNQAQRSIYVTSPYFVPGAGELRELVAAARRGIEVKILLPGDNSDHFAIQAYSRSLYHRLLENGVEVYEYGPTMLHTKAMILDGQWSLFGSMNFDQRSIRWNEELVIAAADPELAAQLAQDFHRDLADSRRITPDWLRDRPVSDRLAGAAMRLLEEQI